METGAIYTCGGSGCWTYGLKYGLTRVVPDSRQKGIRTGAKVLCSQAIGDKLYHWFRFGKTIEGKHTPYISFTTGFRNTGYHRDGNDADAVVYALKSYLRNVFVTQETIDWLLLCIGLARDAVLGVDAA